MSAPRLRPHFAPRPDRRIKALWAHPYLLQTHRGEREKKAREAIARVQQSLDEAESILAQGNPQRAGDIVRSGLDAGVEAGILDESAINEEGYRYLGSKKHKMAISVLQYNANRYPRSANIYDSPGEAYMENGQRDPALQMYRKSLELDPKNDNAAARIQKLGGEK